MNTDKLLDKLKFYNQEHILQYWDSLTGTEAETLYQQLENVDWNFLESLDMHKDSDTSFIQPINALSIEDIERSNSEYKLTGLNAIKEGKLCLLLLAGGQGTRLGHDRPKGCFNMGITKEMSIFSLLMENTLKIVKESDTWIHMYIMTSDINYDDTTSFFKEHNYFGYNPKYIHLFRSSTPPPTLTEKFL